MDFRQCSFEQVQALADNIEGWLMPSEAVLFYNLASSLKGNGAIVEIGSWCSKSLTYFCAAAIKANNNCKKISIDPFINSKGEPNGKYETFIDNLKTNGLYEHVIHIKEKSQDAGKDFNEKIELLFIDGFHKYEAVKADFDLFYPNLVEEGYVAIHDVIAYEGPTRVVKERVQSDDTFKILELNESTILAQKVENLTPEDRAKNKAIVDKIDAFIKGCNIVQTI